MIVKAIGNAGFGSYEMSKASTHIALEPSTKDATHILCPGFVDQHIHGGFGIDFMSASSEDMNLLANKLSQVGYELFFPTTVTETPQAISKAISQLPNDPRIGGFHLEGPFISPAFPGAQPKSHIESVPNAGSQWDEVLEDPRLKVITLAPELPNATDLIDRLVKKQVHVGMGHSNANFEEAHKAYIHGAIHCTHTFNAMRGLHHREIGLLGFALITPNFFCELIYDRVHVSREAASLLLKCKGMDYIIAVSDGTMASGMASGTQLKMWGLDAIVGDKEVRLPDGTLAGSAITLLDAFQHLAEDFGAEFAIRATSLNPRRFLGIDALPNVYCVFDLYYKLVEIIDLGGLGK